jgi:formylmethanofuran dehydrogenase subunit E
MSDMLKCDKCGVMHLAEDLKPGKQSKVYCRDCYKGVDK